jgi:hypothetical protein
MKTINKLFALLLLVSLSVGASAPQAERKKYTVEQLKLLKPPLSAQQFTLKPKACWPPVSQPPTDMQSPTPQRKKLKKYSNRKVPNNTPDLRPSTAPAQVSPFPEIVLQFEALK